MVRPQLLCIQYAPYNKLQSKHDLYTISVYKYNTVSIHSQYLYSGCPEISDIDSQAQAPS